MSMTGLYIITLAFVFTITASAASASCIPACAPNYECKTNDRGESYCGLAENPPVPEVGVLLIPAALAAGGFFAYRARNRMEAKVRK